MIVDVTSVATAPTYAPSTGGSDQLGQQEFLMLLVTQLSHQDPMNPMSNQEFIAQMAQFSTLESMTAMSEAYQDNADLAKAGQAHSLVGSSIEAVDSNGTHLAGVVWGTEVVNGEIMLKTGEGLVPLDSVVKVTSFDNIRSYQMLSDVAGLIEREATVNVDGAARNAVIVGVRMDDDELMIDTRSGAVPASDLVSVEGLSDEQAERALSQAEQLLGMEADGLGVVSGGAVTGDVSSIISHMGSPALTVAGEPVLLRHIFRVH